MDERFHHNSQKQTHASIWIRLVALPHEYWRERTLKEIASVVGTPISLDAPTRNRAFGHYARILVDIDLSKRVFDEILIEREGFAFKVEVQYERHPLFCHRCYVIGHNVMTCKWLHQEAAKENRGKTQVAEISKKFTPQHCGDKGASSSGTFQYVVVVSLAAAMEVTKNASESVAPPKDVSASAFSFALNNVTDSIPQGALPSPTIPVLDLVTDEVHSSPPVYNVEHIDVHEETFVSPIQMIPSDHQSTVEPAITALDDTDDLVAGQGSEQQASSTDATIAARGGPKGGLEGREPRAPFS